MDLGKNKAKKKAKLINMNLAFSVNLYPAKDN